MIEQSYQLNLIPQGIQTPYVNVSQYDKLSRTIKFSLLNGEEDFTIPSGATATVRGTKPDNTGFEYECTYDGTEVSFDVQEQMTILSGVVPCEIRITLDGEIIGSCNFGLRVERSPLGDDIVISETDLPLIEKAGQNVEEIELLKDQTRQYAQMASGSAEQAEAYAEQAKEYAENNKKVYGIKRLLTTASCEWTRTDDAVGLVAKATLDGSSADNDFDKIYPWSDIISVNMENDGTINAKYGDVNFAWDGSNGEVMTYFPPFYWDRYQDGEYEYIKVSKDQFTNGKYQEGFYLGRYDTSSGAHSHSGTFPQVNTTITNFRSQAQAKGSGWGQLDYHYMLVVLLYLVEYANYNSQLILGNGVSSIRYVTTDTAVVAENNVNRIIITTDNTAYEVGTAISIGTSQGSFDVAEYRTITSKETVSQGTAIYFDGNPVNIAVGNVLWGCGQISGQLDSLGMKSGSLNNNGRHSMIYRGVENLFGNVWQFVDGVNIKDNLVYICYDQPKYKVDTFNNGYEPLSYTNASTNGWAKTVGYDSENPLVGFATGVGGSATTYLADYYYQNSGNRIALVGGAFAYGASDGVSYWNFYYTSGNSARSLGSRLFKTIV